MISVFDMFSIGIGPSSSHTVGPMRAANQFIAELKEASLVDEVTELKAELYGSLGQTGIGHGSGTAIVLGFSGYEPETLDTDLVPEILRKIAQDEAIDLYGNPVKFPRKTAIVYNRRKSLPEHANGMILKAYNGETVLVETAWYSIGGGFIIKAEDFAQAKSDAEKKQEEHPCPFPFETAQELLKTCEEQGLSIPSLMMENEKTQLPKTEVEARLNSIWETMEKCIDKGIRTEGILPGGLKVKRRAPSLFRRLSCEQSSDPLQIMDWVNLYALAVNEENAAGGRVVTAPTNGAAGIIPAVLKYYDQFIKKADEHIVHRYLLTAAAIGILYKKNASISGAEVGCQGEVGVACSMAAGALAEIMGGSVSQVENAAEIGMEHNLGLTCDPVGGLVQVPCIERNAMGAIKAINAARIALRGSGEQKVSLDKVIKTMWDTGNDMKSKYKETARGGLAVNIIEC